MVICNDVLVSRRPNRVFNCIFNTSVISLSVFIIFGVKILEGHFAFKQEIHDFKNNERLRRSYWLASELPAWT